MIKPSIAPVEPRALSSSGELMKLVDLVENLAPRVSTIRLLGQGKSVGLKHLAAHFQDCGNFIFLDGESPASANMRNSDCRYADFAYSICNNALFEYADLSNTKFIASELMAANFSFAKLHNANLSLAKLNQAVFVNSDLERAELPNTDWRNTTIEKTIFFNANLKQANFEDVTLSNITFEQSNLSQASMTGSKFSNCSLFDCNLSSAKLGEINWEHCDLRGAKLVGCQFHFGSSRSGLVGSPYPSHGTRTGFYTDEFHDHVFKRVEEIRKASMFGCDLRAADVFSTDFYLVDLREALYDSKQREHFQKCGAILHD